jgi:hypothetical protein
VRVRGAERGCRGVDGPQSSPAATIDCATDCGRRLTVKMQKVALREQAKTDKMDHLYIY